MDFSSDFLYARPSALEGIARLIDFGNTLSEYNTSEEPDEVALRMDWMSVGSHLHEAMKHCAQEMETESVLSVK